MEPFIGQIMQVGFSFAPQGWANCDGQLISISQNSALFSLLGTTYGGNGTVTFALPDLRGRSMVHTGQGPGLPAVQIGEAGGVAQLTLTAANLPPHNHTLAANGGPANSDTPVNAYPAVAQGGTEEWSTTPGNNQFMSAGMVGSTGGGVPVSTRSPYLGILHIIALQGVFPSRP
jgi:microcystin-dependent protein